MTRWEAGHHLLWPTVVAHVFDAPEPGPTAWIQAGIHGDEIAGVHALEGLLEAGLRPDRGRLVIVPVMNPPAYRAGQRAAPGGLDLNRQFPGDLDHERYEPMLAARFMRRIMAEAPALVATLHESKKRYDPSVTPSFGQTLVYGVVPCPALFESVVDAMNHNRRSDEERWDTLYYPVSTSSTEVIVDAVGCLGVCVETWMGFPLDRRVEMQQEVVRRLLQGVGVLDA